MANIAVGDRVLVTINSTLFNQRIMATFCYGVSSLTGSPSQSSAFDALHTYMVAGGKLVSDYRACCPEQLEVISVWYQVKRPIRYNKFTRTTGLGLGTLDGNNYYAANQAAVILRRGDLGNRSNVSTLHVPLGQSVGCQAGGLIGADIEAPLADLAAEIKASITTTGVVMTLNPVIDNGVSVGDFTPIIETSVQTTVRTMSRRNVGRGI